MSFRELYGVILASIYVLMSVFWYLFNKPVDTFYNL